MYEYKAKCIKVIDGDTIDVDIDLGFNTHFQTRVRLAGIDTPELRAVNPLERQAAQQIRNYVKAAIEGRDIILKTYKDPSEDKYGRYLAMVYINEQNMNNSLVEMKYAKEYDGGKKIVWSDEELKGIVF